MNRKLIVATIFSIVALCSKGSAQSPKGIITEFREMDRAAVTWPTEIEQHQGQLLKFGNFIAINKSQIESINFLDDEVVLTLTSSRTILITAKTHFVTARGIYYDLIELLDTNKREVTQISEEQRTAIETKLDEYYNNPKSDKKAQDFQAIQFIYGRSLPWPILSRYCKLEWK